MRILKLSLISIVILFLVLYFISLMIPSDVRVSRAINIEANRDSIMTEVADMREWQKWNVLVNDSGITNKYNDFKTFHSDQLQVEIRIVKADSVRAVWRQQNGKEIVSGFNLHTKDGITVVQWFFDFHLRWYPWEKLGSIVFDKQLGPPMERSLGNLKKMLEKNP